jgi:predicted nucleic acid-binding Zn ribbon protein
MVSVVSSPASSTRTGRRLSRRTSRRASSTVVGSPDGVRAPARGGVLASRLCPVCQNVLIHAGQEVCSGRCRAARSRLRKAEAQRERDAEIRAMLEAAIRKLGENP